MAQAAAITAFDLNLLRQLLAAAPHVEGKTFLIPQAVSLSVTPSDAVQRAAQHAAIRQTLGVAPADILLLLPSLGHKSDHRSIQ